ncbi:MAG: TIGR00159 family protein, partial [Lachnospiraceae bacterium]|nr:TIGR00159 family protein [Lachnospiraceae bacterium]
ALVIIVSEETGKVSVAQNGELFRCLDVIDLRRKLEVIQDKKEGKTRKNGKKKEEEKKDEAKADA